MYLSARSSVCKFFVLILSGWLLVACSEGNGGNSQPDYDRTQLLTNLSEGIIVPRYDSLQTATSQLNTAWSGFKAEPTPSNLELLKAAFQNMYIKWQWVAFYDFGPADDQLLMGSINVFPTSGTKIEANIDAANYNMGLLSNKDAKGLPALDYLLFHATAETVLDELTTEGDAGNRRAYADAVISDIVTRINTTVNTWNSGYTTTFKNSKGNDASSSIAQLINAYIQYVEMDFRDNKLGIPAGVRTSGVKYPEKVESYYAGQSMTLALVTALALEEMYLGKTVSGADGVGLKEHLEGVGANDLAADIATKFSDIKTALAAIPDPLSGTIDTNNAVVLEAYDEIQSLVALLKVDMTSALSILITYTDNDGD